MSRAEPPALCAAPALSYNKHLQALSSALTTHLAQTPPGDSAQAHNNPQSCVSLHPTLRLKDTDDISDSRVAEVGALEVSQELERRFAHHHPRLVEGLDLREEHMSPSCHQAVPSPAPGGSQHPQLCPLCPAAPTGLVKHCFPSERSAASCPCCAWNTLGRLFWISCSTLSHGNNSVTWVCTSNQSAPGPGRQLLTEQSLAQLCLTTQIRRQDCFVADRNLFQETACFTQKYSHGKYFCNS